METRTYTERSNARRAARAFGVDPDSITETDDGFTFPIPAETNGHDDASKAEVRAYGRPPIDPVRDEEGNDVNTDASADQVKVAPTGAADDLDIPESLKLTPEQRKESWIKNPPKVALAKWKEDVAMTKAKAKVQKTKGKSGSDKTALLLSMLKGKGSTVEAMTKALDWLPHTLRARISRLPKDDKKIKIERERVDGVTSYRIAS